MYYKNIFEFAVKNDGNVKKIRWSFRSIDTYLRNFKTVLEDSGKRS